MNSQHLTSQQHPQRPRCPQRIPRPTLQQLPLTQEQQLQLNQVNGRNLLRRVNKFKGKVHTWYEQNDPRMAIVLKDPSGIVDLTESVRECAVHLKIREKNRRYEKNETKTPPSLMFQSALSLVLCANKKLWEECWQEWCQKKYIAPRYPFGPSPRLVAGLLVETYYVKEKFPLKFVAELSGASPDTFCVAASKPFDLFDDYWALHQKVQKFYTEPELVDVQSDLSCDDEEEDIVKRRQLRRYRRARRAAAEQREREKPLPLPR